MPTRAQIADAARGSRRELVVAAIVFAWIALGAGTDSGAGIWRQRLVGVVTWALLVALLRGENRTVRIQVVGVIIVATCVEYGVAFLGTTYRLHNVPSYASATGWCIWRRSLRLLAGGRPVAPPFIVFTLVVRRPGPLGSPARAPDASSAPSYLFLLRFTLRGSRPLVYAGRSSSRATSSWSEPRRGWAWARHDPTGIFIGNPPRYPRRILLPRPAGVAGATFRASSSAVR